MSRILYSDEKVDVAMYDDNELEIRSKLRDPPKIRLAVDADKVESNLGCLSFNVRRGDGRHEEYGYVMGRLTADKQEGALYVALRQRGEPQSRELLYLDPQGALFRVPVSAPNLSAPPSTGGGRFYHEGGRFCTVYQADGHVVEYEIRDTAGTLRPEAEWANFVVWTNWHGLVRPLPW